MYLVLLSKMANENIEIIGSGRTDMGVHAYGQVANFKTTSNLSIEKMKTYLYEYLPEDIVITNIEEVDERFHSRYNAKLVKSCSPIKYLLASFINSISNFLVIWVVYFLKKGSWNLLLYILYKYTFDFALYLL